MMHFILGILLLFVSPIFSECQESIHNKLQTIPQEDREILRSLFFELFALDHFGYTLLGDKPVSLSGDFTLTPVCNNFAKMKQGGRFWNKWKVWMKYRDLFNFSDYLLFDEQSLNKQNIRFVIFINKASFIALVNKNTSLFNETLNKTINPVEMLSEIESGRKSFQDVIGNNELLWGLLLGYGKRNAKLFVHRQKIRTLQKGVLVPAIAEKKMKVLFDESLFFGEYSYSPLIIYTPHFVADPTHSETLALKEKYEKQRRAISEIYANGDLLEITLSKLSGSPKKCDE